MGVHSSAAEMFKEAVEEYLAAAGACISHQKADGGCLGYPAALLLLCAVEAIAQCFWGEPVEVGKREQPIKKSEPFRMLNHSLFGQSLTGDQITKISQAGRNSLAHNAILEPGFWLVKGAGGPAFCFEEGIVGIDVASFLDLVREAWRKFPEERLPKGWSNSAKRLRPRPPREMRGGEGE